MQCKCCVNQIHCTVHEMQKFKNFYSKTTFPIWKVNVSCAQNVLPHEEYMHIVE